MNPRKTKAEERSISNVNCWGYGLPGLTLMTKWFVYKKCWLYFIYITIISFFISGGAPQFCRTKCKSPERLDHFYQARTGRWLNKLLLASCLLWLWPLRVQPLVIRSLGTGLQIFIDFSRATLQPNTGYCMFSQLPWLKLARERNSGL